MPEMMPSINAEPALCAEVVGSGDVPVVFLAGGASSSHGYYPGMSTLQRDHRLIFFDRPGTGHAEADGDATLANGSSALHKTLADLSCSPAVIVGHSLGGAAALHFGMNYPEDVAGLVLLDPTPINDLRIMKSARTGFRVALALLKLPVIGAAVNRTHEVLWRRSLGPLDDEANVSMHAMLATSSSSGMSTALSHILTESETLIEALRPQAYRSVIVTADRKPTSRSFSAHQKVAELIGADLIMWPSTVHALHLQQPKQLAKLIRDVADSFKAGQRT